MKISYNWLVELTGVDWSAEEVADRLTLCGTACEEIESTSRYMDKVVVAEVLDLKPIEGADKICLATVNDGASTFDVVCGAPNVAVGMKVPLAQIGAKLVGDIVIKKVKIRGIESTGMICSERELGLSESHEGIMELDTGAKVGQPLAEYLDFNDYILTFELTPNRADSLSAIGIARDLAALAEVEIKRPKVELNEIEEKASDVVSVAIEDLNACPRYAARVIRGVKIGPSPWWLQKKIITAGMRPISNIVDITNLVMLECGHPLHAFDLDRFGSNEVIVRLAKDKEKFTTLDGQTHELTPDVTMITNGKTGVAVGGVMGGLDSEVEDSTTNILLEAAYFNAPMIRKSRRVLGLVTESSNRFEKGADPNGIEYAIDRAAALMQELCSGQVLTGVVDCYPKKIEPWDVTFRPGQCNRVLGTTLATERMVEILELLQCQVTGDEKLTITVPTFRPDLEREIDLIEEVARIIGFDDIPDAQENIGPLFTPSHFEDDFKVDARRTLTGAGFDEMIHHGMVEGKLAQFMEPKVAPIKILNPVSEDLGVMRTCLAQSALNVVQHNISHRNLDLRLFEIGRVYYPPDKNDNWVEEDRIVLVVTGNYPSDWRNPARPNDFYDLTGTMTALWNNYKLPRYELIPASSDWFDQEISFDIQYGGRSVGRIGQFNQKVLKRFEIKEPVFLAEFSIMPFIEAGTPVARFKPLPVFPAALRDIAVVVDLTTKAGEIVSAVKKTGGDLAESVKLFDLYTGKQIPKGKKSIAVAINYRSAKGNLSSEEVDARQGDVVAMLKKNFNAEIRDK
ncbi:MAG: phenylalanine--tRNA ligase subunit beta [bacterium]|nr:phenylalanine--tRNA ligase subunit beta [bacterium]